MEQHNDVGNAKELIETAGELIKLVSKYVEG